MATSCSQQATFRPLSELLPKNEAGDAEFQHIVSILLQFEVAQAGRRKQRIVPTRIGPGLWLAGRTLCVLASITGRWERLRPTLQHR
jgi:hypothetical protein